MSEEYMDTQNNEENHVSQNYNVHMSDKGHISHESKEFQKVNSEIDKTSYTNEVLSQESLSHKNEKFIIVALISAITIIAVVIGVGWAVFYPKTKAIVQSDSDENNTKKITSELDTKNTDVIDLNAPEDDAIADSGDEDVIIVYGGDSSNDNSQKKESIVTHSKNNKTVNSNSFAGESTKKSVSSSSPLQKTKEKHDVVNKTRKTTVISTKNSASSSLLSNTKRSTASVIKKSQKVKLTATAKVKSATTTPRSVKRKSHNVKRNKNVASYSKKTKTIYWVQVFSTNSREKASKIKKTLERQGIALSIITKDVNKRIYYRLRIGPYYNKSESKKFLNWIKQKYKDAYVTENYI